MKLTSARAAWHDAYYQPWDSVMSVAAEWARLGTSVQTTRRSVNAAHAAHQALAGAVQVAISRLPVQPRAFGHFMYSPLTLNDQREIAEESVFASAVAAVTAMKQAKYEKAEYVAKGVMYRYQRMNQGGQGGSIDPMSSPEAFRAWIADWYGISLDSRNWEREWGAFVEACFNACNDLDRRALGPVAAAINELLDDACIPCAAEVT